MTGKQIDAFAQDFPAHTLSRRSDPETSKEAAAYVENRLAGARGRALYFVRRYPGRTTNELSVLAEDRDFRTIGRRLNELDRLGLIERGAPKKCQVTGRNGTTWYPRRHD